MGKYFDAYKKYYDNLSESKVGNAKSLIESCNIHLSNIKNKFAQIVGSNWEEKGKISTSGILNQTTNNIEKLTEFISNNLLVTCEKADALYLKVSEIKNSEENLEVKKSTLSEYEYQLNGLNDSLAWEKKKTESKLIDSLQGQIKTMQRLIDNISSEISSIESNLNRLAEETNLLITEILQLDGVGVEAIDEIIASINSNVNDTKYGSLLKGVLNCRYFPNHLFIGEPYVSNNYKVQGDFAITYLKNGRAFSTYRQSWGNYADKSEINHLDKYFDLTGREKPFNGGCGAMTLTSILTYETGIQGINPAIGFSRGDNSHSLHGQWDAILQTLRGEATFPMIDPETGKIKKCRIECSNFIERINYSGGNVESIESFERYVERYNLAHPEQPVNIEEYKTGIVKGVDSVYCRKKTADEMKQDFKKAFENGNSIIMNTTAPGFTTGQHFLAPITTSEEGWVVFSDSNHISEDYVDNYNKDLPISKKNLPHYYRWNDKMNEPYTVDTYVDYVVEKCKGDTNAYVVVENLQIVEVSDYPVNDEEQYQEYLSNYVKSTVLDYKEEI